MCIHCTTPSVYLTLMLCDKIEQVKGLHLQTFKARRYNNRKTISPNNPLHILVATGSDWLFSSCHTLVAKC